MKTLTTREFFESPSIVERLALGETVEVTDDGKTSLLVTKRVKPPRKTREQLEREAREICPNPRPHKVNFTEAIRELKGR
ncbi:MAG: hypothetical protein IH623_09120 [Verrucomicrobia bacterium]|nr:hypothetical protein [Verrucomicrobiota bacterium]